MVGNENFRRRKRNVVFASHHRYQTLLGTKNNKKWKLTNVFNIIHFDVYSALFYFKMFDAMKKGGDEEYTFEIKDRMIHNLKRCEQGNFWFRFFLHKVPPQRWRD